MDLSARQFELRQAGGRGSRRRSRETSVRGAVRKSHEPTHESFSAQPKAPADWRKSPSAVPAGAFGWAVNDFGYRRFGAWLLLGLLLFFAREAWAQPNADLQREVNVKVAYLYKFTNYVQWPTPKDPNRPFVIGLIGNDFMVPGLEQVAARREARQRKISLRRLTKLEDADVCDLVFVGRNTTEADSAEIIRRTAERPVLVVGESSGFARNGGPLGFFVDEANTVGFELNLDAAKQRGLVIDARLLKVAQIVRK